MIFLNTYTTLSLFKRTHRKLEVISQITDTLDLILGQLSTCFGILFGCTSLNKVQKQRPKYNFQECRVFIVF